MLNYQLLNGKQGEYNEFYSNNIKQFKILFTVLEKENELLKEANKSENEFIDKVDKETSKDILNPVKKGLIKQYKDEDIDNLSTYSKELAKDNLRKDLEIKSLTEEVNSFKSGKAYKEQNKIIANQKIIINQKDDEINTWKNKFEELADEFVLWRFSGIEGYKLENRCKRDYGFYRTEWLWKIYFASFHKSNE